MLERRTETTHRIAGLYAFSIALVTVLIGSATYMFAGRALEAQLDDRIRSEMTALLHASTNEGLAAVAADVSARGANHGAQGGYLLLNARGRLLAGRIGLGPLRPGWHDVDFIDVDGDKDQGRAYAVRLPGDEMLIVVEEQEPLNAIKGTLLTIFAVGFGAMLLVIVIGGLMVGSLIRQRLERVDEAARAIIGGDLTRRMPVSASNDEFDRLSMMLNNMLDRIAMLMDNLRHVSDDVAHDLRTPLARLRGVLEEAITAKDDGARRNRVTMAIERTDALLDLFSNILRISEVQAGGVRRHFNRVSLSDLAADVTDGYAPAAEDSGHRLIWMIASDIELDGNRDLLTQALSNLIENGLKHTPQGTVIEVIVASDPDNGASVSVSDNGPGVPPSEWTTILRRFGRRDASRSTPGHGLGLNLVAAIAAAHDATMEFGDAQPGLTVKLRFPPRQV